MTLLLSACDSRESKIKAFCDSFKETKARTLVIIENSKNNSNPDSLDANAKMLDDLVYNIKAKSKALLAEGIDVSKTECE